jgi:hypothetical protein
LAREVSAPSGGTPPPATATLEDGEVVHLGPVAHEISRRFQLEFPDEAERYGEAAYAWCVHDNQWLLAWAAEDLELGGRHLAKNVGWLAGLLRARGYPAERLTRDLEIAAEVVGDETEARGKLAAKLREGARSVRRRARRVRPN